jgi:Ca2+-transporting ATPase
MIVDQLTDFMVLVLICAAVIAGLLGEVEDAVAIGVIVVVNAALGFAQEHRAEAAMSALQAMGAPCARVLRGGAPQVVPAAALVPGDLVLIEAGDMLPADLRLCAAAALRVDEAALTGESAPVEKRTDALPLPALPVGDRQNMAHKGTLVTHGRGAGLVVATGMATELGHIAALLRAVEVPQTPLQRRLARFGRRLALVVLALCAAFFGLGLLRGEPPLTMFLTALSLAVAAIPEALPAVLTVSLAVGARTMAGRSALVRRLSAVETLGSVTVICTDKTGTLTENRMRVAAWWEPGGAAAPSPPLLDGMALCSDARWDPAEAPLGDPTEVALVEAAAAQGHDPAALRRAMPRVAELPFSSERARMSTVHRLGERFVVFTKGAPEAVLEACAGQRGPGGPAPVDRAAALAAAEDMASGGLRVLAFATRRLDALPAPGALGAVEDALRFVGLVGLHDPPRPGAAEAVRLCQSAGVRVVMITGDHPATAAAVARALGVLAEGGAVMTGAELAALSPEALAARSGAVQVYARMAPEQKIRVVRALQAQGELVAMTGDGVNDAPALRQADIGVAMGRGGTDVAREAAHMVLLDDNFATIVGAVREGRRIYDNLRRFIRYALAGNAGELVALVAAPLLGLPIPLEPIHILWVNLVTDGLPGLALAAEPAEPGLMTRPPRPPAEGVFARGLWQHAALVGLLIGGLTLAVHAWARARGDPHGQTMAFTVLTLAQMGHVLAVRSEHTSLFALGLRSNLPLLAAVLLSVALQLAVIYLPLVQPIFKTQALTAAELGLCLGLSSLVFLAVEVEKWMIRRGWLYRAAARGRPRPGPQTAAPPANCR